MNEISVKTEYILPPEVTTAIRLMLTDAQAKRKEAEQIEAHVRALIVRVSEVDVEQERWTLNLEQGTLTKDNEDGTDQS